MIRRALVVASAGAALVLAGCGTLDTGQLETITAERVEQAVGRAPASVTCPEDVKAQAGSTFTCTVAGADGTTATIDVTQKDDEGHVELAGALLKIPQLEQSIEQSASAADAAADCPDIVAIEAGMTFTCEIVAGGETATVRVTMQDDQGNVTFEQA